MIGLNNKISCVASCLQTLTKPEFSNEIQEAVKKNDKTLLVGVCKKAKVPHAYIGSVVSVIMSVSPQKWPEDF